MRHRVLYACPDEQTPPAKMTPLSLQTLPGNSSSEAFSYPCAKKKKRRRGEYGVRTHDTGIKIPCADHYTNSPVKFLHVLRARIAKIEKKEFIKHSQIGHRGATRCKAYRLQLRLRASTRSRLSKT